MKGDIMEYQWCEITGKEWDRLCQGAREIFLTPNEHNDKSHLAYAGRKDILLEMGIEPIRDIDS